MTPRGKVREKQAGKAKFSDDELEELIEEATVDSNGEDEYVDGMMTAILDNLKVPFKTLILGLEATVEDVTISKDDRVVAKCKVGTRKQDLSILDLIPPDPLPEGWKWVEAYRLVVSRL